MGIPAEHLTRFEITDKLPHRLLKLIRDGREIYNWLAYADSFGFTALERIHDKQRISTYIQKYIYKAIDNSDIGLNKRLYYCSKGLNRAVEVHRGYLHKDFEADYNNEYVSIKTVYSFEEARNCFSDKEGVVK